MVWSFNDELKAELKEDNDKLEMSERQVLIAKYTKAGLTKQEAKIIIFRWHDTDQHSQEDLAQMFKVSQQRVSAILKKALSKLKRLL
jgi:RNA polymerase sigma factor (sigma-70 family)